MSYLLDTDVCVHFLNGTAPEVRERFEDVGPDALALCSVVKAELLLGARRSADPAGNAARLDGFFRVLGSLPFDDRAASHHADIRAALARAGTPIGAHDLMIASIARGTDRVLVTRNLAEFERVPDLRLERW